MAAPNPPRPDEAEIEQLRREMARIRREIHADVNVAARHLSNTLNWRGYVRDAPWAAAGAALGVGLLVSWMLVPRRRIQVVQRSQAEASSRPPRYEEPTEREVEQQARRKGLASMALGFLAPIALRVAQNYAIQFIEDRLLAPSSSPWAGPSPEEEGRGFQPDQSAPGRPR